jgi:hypothetical protein
MQTMLYLVRIDDKEGLNQIRGERLDQQKRMEVEMKKVRDELQEIKNCNTGGSGEHTDEAELKKLQKEMEGMKVEIESVVNNSVRNVKVDVEEALEIERRKCNLVIHGMPETDAEQDVGCVVEMMDEVLHMDFTRNVDKVERIGTFGGKEGNISKSQVVEGGGKVQENVYISGFNKEAARERQGIEKTIEVDS